MNWLSRLMDGTTVGRLLDLYRLAKLAKASDGSFANEFESLHKLANKLNIKNGFIVDVAASDGFSQSPTLGFFKAGWGGLAVEMDPIKFSSLSFLYANFPKVRLAKDRVTPFNITSLLESFEAPKDITILNLDIDSYDLYVLQSMLKDGFCPQIISMEINEKIPSGIFFTVNYDGSHYWQGDHFYGCSIDAAAMIVKPFGYKLFALEYNNALFVRDNVAPSDLIDLSPEDAYNNGYKNKPDRKTLFPWNENVEEWIEATPIKAKEMIDIFFEKYKGKYTMTLSKDFSSLK